MPRSSSFSQWTLMLCVPLVSLGLLGRQIYLSRYYELSTWKGGGMGMFAAADELPNRYAKIFLIDASGDQDPLVQLSPENTEILNRALEYPTRGNFLRAARKIATANWIPAYQRRPVLIVDNNGEPVRTDAKSFRVMVPSSLQSDREEKKSRMEIQFWKIRYDPITRRLYSTLAETFVFTPEELFGLGTERKNS